MLLGDGGPMVDPVKGVKAAAAEVDPSGVDAVVVSAASAAFLARNAAWSAAVFLLSMFWRRRASFSMSLMCVVPSLAPA